MRLTAALLLSGVIVLAGCSREEQESRPALEQAREKHQASVDEAEARISESAAEARKALAAARKRWDELRPEAEKAIVSLEQRLDNLVEDSEALKRLPPDVLERVRERLDAMRRKLAEARVAHEQGDTDLAVEKADAVQRERAAVEELLVERPD
jgi:hypothetical protein